MKLITKNGKRNVLVSVVVLLIVFLTAFGFYSHEARAQGWETIIIGAAIGGGAGGVLTGDQCLAWKSPNDDSYDCELCGKNDLVECNEYMCKSIGRGCVFDNGNCIEQRPDDASSPKVLGCEFLMKDEDGNTVPGVARNEVNICEFGPIPNKADVALKIVTDEPSLCEFSFEPRLNGGDFVSSRTFGFFPENQVRHQREHFQTINFNLNDDEFLRMKQDCDNDNCVWYLKCEDIAGNFNRVDYFLKFDIEPGEDHSPPIILNFNLENGVRVVFGQDSVDLRMLVYDLAPIEGCKYSEEDKDYDLMENQFSCEVDANLGNVCSSTLRNVEDGVENKYYLRCRDDSPNMNVNEVSYEFVVNGGNTLEMNILEPSNGAEVIRSNELVVSTSGGNDAGGAQCYYQWKTSLAGTSYNQRTAFNLGVTEHRQILSFLDVPDSALEDELGKKFVEYDVKIVCEDGFGNNAEEEASFKLVAEPLVVSLVSEIPNDGDQNIEFSVVTSGGYNGDGEARCSLFEDQGFYKYEDSEKTLDRDGNTHTYSRSGVDNGNYEWRVICEDLIGKSAGFADVNFMVETPALGLSVVPGTGTLNVLSTEVGITTTGGIDNDNAVCKYLPIGDSFVEGLHYDDESYNGGIVLDGSPVGARNVILPSEDGRFSDGVSGYYFVCKDAAGKVVGQKVEYTVDHGQFGLTARAEFDRLETLDPQMSVITEGGIGGNGDATCWVEECNGDLETDQIGEMTNVRPLENGHVQGLAFTDLSNGGYSCVVKCSDDLSDESRTVVVSETEFVVDTPNLGMEIKWPNNGGSVRREVLELIVETFGGVDNGNSVCYWTDGDTGVFEAGGVVDITKRTVSSLYFAEVMCSGGGSCKRNIGGRYEHIQTLRNRLEEDMKTISIQCKDNAGKLSPELGPARIDIEVT